MALVGSYTYDWNRNIPSVASDTDIAAGLLWTFVHQLLGLLGGLTSGIWTCEGSSNGTVGAIDGVNRWWNGGTFSAALMPWAMEGSAHAWMVIKSPANFPGGQQWWLITRSTPAGQSTSPSDYDFTCFNVRASTQAFTGGSNTAPPTSAVAAINCYTIFADGYWATNGILHSVKLGTAGNTTNRRCHLTLASDGGFLWSSNIVGGKLNNGIGLIPLLDSEVTDLRAFVMLFLSEWTPGTTRVPWAGGYAGVNNTSNWSVIHLQQNLNSKILWLQRDQPRSQRAMWGFAAKSGNTTAALNCGPIVPVMLREAVFNAGNVGEVCDPAFLNNYTLDTIRNRYIEMPVYVHTARVPSPPAMRGVRGKLRDVTWALGIPEGSNDPVGTDPITRVAWGDLWVPSPNQTWTP